MDINLEYVSRAKQGDAQSFAMLYDQVAKDLYRVALYTLGNPQDAEDVVSETFLEAYKGLRNLRDDSKFKAWIMRILSIRCKRKISSYITAKQQISLDDFIETPGDVSEVLRENPSVRVLSAVQGYTTREIGEILDLPHGTVSSKLYRTLIKLRKKLEQQ